MKALRSSVPYTPPPRAPYAEDPTASRGRRHREPPSRTRMPWARDRDRVIHSTAFRRLKEKTQVFVAHEGDHYRTRLTHSLEVAQIARSIAGAMGLDSDLAEAVALAHDLGHPPFGHAGEDELQRVMEPHGGFDHNVQTFRILTSLERRYPGFDGLNVTWETLEGVVKHNGPITDRLTRPSYKTIVEYSAAHDLALGSWPSAEAQVANLADDIAYNNHDVDDGLQAGLFDLDDLSEVALVGPIIGEVRREHPVLDRRMQRLEVVRRMIGVMVDDVMAETRRRAAEHGVCSADEVRAAGQPLVAFSDGLVQDLARLRAFLHTRMYRHYRMNRTRSAARRILREMFELFMAEPEVLPEEWRARTDNRDAAGRARVVCDYVAGMTDRYAIEEHRKLFQLDIWN
ncbi:MAG: deoxyguanosinetriphosphate triphosphohydrolase [Pseudomonadota bacterium]|nr:deoxyguanosinetriphosphate triphosphohydrolase [Pseudomonadota bacterium]